MSCIYNIWNCYCKLHEHVCDKPCSPVCKDYCCVQTAVTVDMSQVNTEELKKMFNKGPIMPVIGTCCSDVEVVDKYPFEFRFVLTLILGYLGKLDSVDIILCHDPKEYFKNKAGVNLLRKPNLSSAVNKTRSYVKESKDANLAAGMRMVEQWFEEVAKENIPAKELTIADIEKQLGYKIKIVGDDK